MDEGVLHRYQARLIELLREGVEPERVRAELVAEPELASLRSYVQGLDLHALSVAKTIVAKWSPSADQHREQERKGEADREARAVGDAEDEET